MENEERKKSYRWAAPDYFVAKDTREKQGYTFTHFNNCLGMVEKKLDTGDYSIVGLEDKLCIERKASVEELAINLGNQKTAFMNEIERMKEFEHRFLVFEFSVKDVLKFPEGTDIPFEKREQTRITSSYILKMISDFQVFDGINVLFCGDKASAFFTVVSLLKRINEKYTIGRRK